MNLINFLEHHNSILLKNVSFSHGNTTYTLLPLLLCPSQEPMGRLSTALWGVLMMLKMIQRHISGVHSRLKQLFEKKFEKT